MSSPATSSRRSSSGTRSTATEPTRRSPDARARCRPRSSRRRDRVAVEDFVRVAAVADVPPGKMLALRVEREDVVLYNVEGAIYASRDFCPHAGFQLSKSAFRGKYVRCSLHAWEFDVTNGEYTGNPRIHMKCFPVKVVGDEIWISLLPLIPPKPRPPLSRDDA